MESHFFVDEKNLQKLGLKGELISAYLYYMIILSFEIQFAVWQLVKQWLTIVNSVLIVVSNCLTTVKQYLTIFFFQKLCVIGKISIRWSKNKQRTIEKAEILKIPNLIYSHKYLISLLRKSGLTVPIFLSTRKTYKI